MSCKLIIFTADYQLYLKCSKVRFYVSQYIFHVNIQVVLF